MADYINRNEAIAALTEFRYDQTVSKYVSVENCMVARGAIERATKVLESLPAPDVEPVQQWISVDEPPKEYRDEYGELIPFLVCEEGTDYPFRAMYDGKTWGDGIFAVSVKWWMHLPAPPKEKERKDGDVNV